MSSPTSLNTGLYGANSVESKSDRIFISPTLSVVAAAAASSVENLVPSNSLSSSSKERIWSKFDSERVFMGKLGARWQFPSDHLPIGATINGHHFLSWNVLNKNFVKHCTDGNQGLENSLLDSLNKKETECPGITERELAIYQILQTFLSEPAPYALLCLQECDIPFIEFLKDKIPAHYQVIIGLPDNPKSYNQNICIYDSTKLDYLDKESSIIPRNEVFSIAPPGPMMSLCFVDKLIDTPFRVINAHLTGKPGSPAPQEYIAYLKSLREKNVEETVIAMGDMNCSKQRMSMEITKAGFVGIKHFAPYNTLVDYNSKEALKVDQMIISSKEKIRFIGHEPNLVYLGLEELATLLHTPADSVTA